jgi:hypothetical protein
MRDATPALFLGLAAMGALGATAFALVQCRREPEPTPPEPGSTALVAPSAAPLIASEPSVAPKVEPPPVVSAAPSKEPVPSASAAPSAAPTPSASAAPSSKPAPVKKLPLSDAQPRSR